MNTFTTGRRARFGRLRCFLFAAVIPLLPSCLEFDEQEIHLRYDAEKDRLDALLIYRGLYDSPGDGSDAKQMLAVCKTIRPR